MEKTKHNIHCLVLVIDVARASKLLTDFSKGDDRITDALNGGGSRIVLATITSRKVTIVGARTNFQNGRLVFCGYFHFFG